MNETIKTKAQSLYPVEEKANEYTAFMQGAELALKIGFRRGIREVFNRIVCGLESGRLTEDDVTNLFKAIEEK